MPFQGDNAAAKDVGDGLNSDSDVSSEDIRLTLFIASSSFIIMTLITIIGVVSCVILCNDNDGVTSSLVGSDYHDLWPPAKLTTPSDLGESQSDKRLLHGHSVEDEFMEGTGTPGHLISPEVGSYHWPHNNHHHSNLPLINHPFASMITARLEPERNYLTSITGLTPITEISVEETQTSTDPNDQAFVDNNRINNNKTEQRQSNILDSEQQVEQIEPTIFNFDSSETLVENSRIASENLVEQWRVDASESCSENSRIASESSAEQCRITSENLVENSRIASGRHHNRPAPPPRPPRRPKRNANCQTETKTNGLSTPQTLSTCQTSPLAIHPSSSSSSNLDQALQLTVSMAPISSARHHSSHGTSHANRHCKHCTMSQHNCQAPERIDKASNTEKSCGNKHQ